MSENLMPEERFILEFIVGCFPYIFLLTVMISRILQISHLPSNSSISSTISLRIKMFLTLSMAIVLIMLPVLAYKVDGFWLYNRNVAFSLIFLIHSFVLILQTLIMRYEFKKQVPSPWYINLLFWALIALLYFIFFMNSLLFQVFSLFFLFLSDFYKRISKKIAT